MYKWQYRAGITAKLPSGKIECRYGEVFDTEAAAQDAVELNMKRIEDYCDIMTGHVNREYIKIQKMK